MTVGRHIQPPDKPMVRELNSEIALQLSRQISGLSYGESHHLTITSQAITDLPKMERYLQYARVMRRPKQRKIPKAQFISETGKEPVVGEVLFTDRIMQWKVIDVTEDSVEVGYLVEDGQIVMNPFGKAVMRDRGDHYDMEIETPPGGLVRVGPYIGRIVDINDRVFIIDFEHPFGGRELACDVTVSRAEESIDDILNSAAVSDEKENKQQ